VTSVYRSAPRLEDALVIAISQSGRSPDLIDYARAARDAGARVAALVNTPGSPLEDVATHVLPLGAGPERSVAATKSFLCSLSALIHLTGRWAGDAAALEALDGLPALLRQAASHDWSPVTATLGEARNLFVVGRGTGFAVALEAALKLKETCGLHAEAISSAEVQHGPMALVGAGFPVLFLAQNDESAEGTRALAERFRARGASVLVAGPPELEPDLPIAVSPDPACTSASLIQSFYLAAAALAQARGFDPDVPPHLEKVTETR
jgi:glucosamine--fructose-6-phosphate aminotransferase (isomerizing)